MLEDIASLRELSDRFETQVALEKEVKLSARAIRDILRVPGAAGQLRENSRNAIAKAMSRHRPFPITAEMKAVRTKYLELKAFGPSDEFEEFLAMSVGLLNKYSPKGSWDEASLAYMRGVSLLSMAMHRQNDRYWFGGPENWPKLLKDAEETFEVALQKVDAAVTDLGGTERQQMEDLRPFLFTHRAVTILERARQGYERSVGQAVAVIGGQQALEQYAHILSKHRNLWQAAWNGLDLAEEIKTKESDEIAIVFYERLKAIDPAFQSFDYKPGEVGSLTEEMPHFSKRFRKAYHKDLPEKKTTNPTSKGKEK